MLEDIAILTGASPIIEATRKTLESVTLKDLGTARKIMVEKENRTIVEGVGSKEAI